MRLEDNFRDKQMGDAILNNTVLSTDLLTMFIGKKIGEGQSRTVYDYNLDPDYVVKIETKNTGHNNNEYLIWDEVQGLKNDLLWVKKWFAPVHYISPCGRILIMEKTEEKPDKKRPDKVPDFLDDTHYNNFGWIGNKFVCHDYGFIYKFINYKKKMVRACYSF